VVFVEREGGNGLVGVGLGWVLKSNGFGFNLNWRWL